MEHKLAHALIKAGVPEDQISGILAALPAPDAEQWNPDPAYLRELLQQTGLSQRKASRLIGVPVRTFRDYFTGARKITYSVQYALEMLALLNIPENLRKRESEAGDE